ncbi:MAG: PAS domain S-box protein [Proteobacteria bacterium]|nr:PAS domain S-box protein [Pseudomonadota bacterium]
MTTDTGRNDSRLTGADKHRGAGVPGEGEALHQLELVRMYFDQMPTVMLVNIFNAVIVGAVVWPNTPDYSVLIWAGAIIAFALLRAGIWLVAWRGRSHSVETVRVWQRLAVVSSGLGGIGWGIGGVVVFVVSPSTVDHVFMAFVLGGMGAGAMAGLTAMLPVFYASVWPMFIPFGVVLLTGDDITQVAMGAMVLVYAAAISIFSRNVDRWLDSSVRLREENAGLVGRLVQAHEFANNEVVERTRELSRANEALEHRLRELDQAQRALTENERQMRLITDSIPAVVASIDSSLRIRFVNEKYETWFGNSREHVQGMPIDQIVGDEAFSEIDDPYTRVLAGEAVTYEADRNTRLGRRRLQVSLVPNRQDDGQIDGMFALGIDRTEEYEAHDALTQSEDRLRRVIQNMPVMMFALDEQGEIIVWNRECERVTGFPANEVVGNPKGLELLWPNEERRAQVRRTLLEHSDYRDWEWDVMCKGGGNRTISWFNISAAYPVPGWSSWQMGFDVSVRRRARQELEQTLEKERELGELKSRFVAMASHEFRTPLTTIQAAVEIVRRYGPRMSDDEKDSNLAEIVSEVGNITHLLDDILNFGRVDSGQMEVSPTPIDIEELFEELIDKARLQATDRHELEFRVNGNGSEVLLDEQIFRQVVGNLLSNAIKYSPDGGPVMLEAWCEDQRVRVACTDAGLGIPEIGRDRLFEPFHRFDNVGAISGTGLGLAIIKRAVASHGGAITCESQEGMGTTFRVTLPQGLDTPIIGQLLH